MKKELSLIKLLLLLSVNAMIGQDIQLTQIYSAPLYLNPAFTGSNGCSRVSLLHRNQWTGVSSSYKTSLLSMDQSFDLKNVGAGLMVGVDEAGTGKLKTTFINPSLAYHLKLNRHYTLRFGVQPGFVMKTINFDKLTFADQISRGQKQGTEVSSIEVRPMNKTYLDVGAGLLLNNEIFWIGGSVYHFNKPNESLYANQKTIVPIKYSAHAGAKFLLNKEEKLPQNKKYLSPIIHYKGQAEFDQVDVGFYFTQNILSIGLWYRGIPILKAYKPGYQNNDALAIILGLNTERFNVGYSYDVTISKLTNKTNGSHEISLSYQICRKNKKPKYRLISCPKF